MALIITASVAITRGLSRTPIALCLWSLLSGVSLDLQSQVKTWSKTALYRRTEMEFMDLWGDLSSHYDWMVSMVMLKNVTCCGGVFDTVSRSCKLMG